MFGRKKKEEVESPKVKLTMLKCICDDDDLERKDHRSSSSQMYKIDNECDCGIKQPHYHCRECGRVFENSSTRLLDMLAGRPYRD